MCIINLILYVSGFSKFLSCHLFSYKEIKCDKRIEGFLNKNEAVLVLVLKDFSLCDNQTKLSLRNGFKQRSSLVHFLETVV